MNEMQKSGIFAAVALVVLTVGFLVKPATEIEAVPDDSGESFWKSFDSRDVADLEIQTYNEKTGKPVALHLVKEAGSWKIATHEKYPTDADNKLADAASAVSTLEKGAIVSESAKDHEIYGLIEPPLKGEPGLTGIGTKVVMRSKGGDTLVSLIIGKEVPKTGPAANPSMSRTNEEFRYVRRPGEDRVYQAKIQPSRLPTDFSEWINTDLLQLDQHNIKQVEIDNYSLKFFLDPQQGGMVVSADFVEKLVLHYNNKAPGTPEQPNWTLDQLVFDPKKRDYKPVKMDPATEELDVQKLNDMRLALDDLKIVDVRRKPEELSKELRLTGKPEARRNFNMETAGFFVLPDGDVKSKEGEVVVGMADGVEYVLRFGSVVEARATSEKKDDAKKDIEKSDKKDQEEKDKKTTRYLLVTARFNQGLLTPPQLELYPDGPLPTKPGEEKPEEKKPEEKTEEKKPEGKADEKKADEKKADEKKADEKKPAPKAEEKTPAAKAEPKKSCEDDAEEEQAEEKKAEVKADEGKAEPKAEPAKTEVKAEPAKAEPAKTETKAEPAKDDPLAAERGRIDRENDIKQRRFEQEKVDGQRKVDALNKRFGDWYYIISDDVFKKIRLDRAQIIKTKKAEGAGNLPADFDILKGGLKPPTK